MRKATARVLYLALLGVAVPFLLWNGFVQQISAGLEDVLIRLRTTHHGGAVEQIVLLGIDDQTVARYGQRALREFLAEGLKRLSAFQPRVLALDLLLTDAGSERTDAEVAASLRRFDRLVLAAALDPGRDRRGWVLPRPEFLRSAVAAHAHADPEPDGVVRSVMLAKNDGALRLWALGLETARLALGADAPLEATDHLQIGEIRVPAPASTQRQMRVNYAGPEGTYRRIPFADLLDGTANASEFKDRIVIVGVTLQGRSDRLLTPVSTGLGMSGIEIHANVARTILDAAFLNPMEPAAQLGASMAVCLLCAVAAAVFRGWRLFLLLALLLAAIPAACTLALRYGQLWPVGSFLAVYGAAAVLSLTGEFAFVAGALQASERKRRDYTFRVQAIAHEIKTPLTAIQGSSELMAGASIPEAQKERVAGLIFKESRRLSELVNTFLDVERISSGALKLERQPVNLKQLSDDVVERARLYGLRKQIDLRSDVGDLQVEADPELLAFALYNLLTNAIKYSPRGGEVRLSAAAANGLVAITVADKGPGIAPEERDRIFERFYRGRRERTGPEEGLGIGLALVKEIVTQHGGRIVVESSPGAGSRFTITLPGNER